MAAAATLMPEMVFSAPAEFTLPKLPYATDALEPFIDRQTMELHHGKHHSGYVQKLNEALSAKPAANLPLIDLMLRMKGQPDAVRNNGGGHFNHSQFWMMMRPAKEGNLPVGEIASRIESTFGGFDNFKSKFKEAAMGRFGSGWAWLCTGKDGKLFITSTPNQDNPLMNLDGIQNGQPVLGIDVWEHAYYLRYQNRRAEYVDAFWNIVNWDECERRLITPR